MTHDQLVADHQKMEADHRGMEAADSVITPTQRELFPMLRNMVATPQRDRENSQWQFGYPVPLDPKANSQPVPRRQ